MSIDVALGIKVINELKKQLDNTQEIIMSGRMANIEEYRYSFGYRKAVEDTIELVQQIQDELMSK